MATRTLFFDLDGTLLDSFERYYRVHEDCIAGQAERKLSADAYWSLKRSGVAESAILDRIGFTGERHSYLERRAQSLESPDYLDLDRVHPGARELLERLHRTDRLVVVTHRRQREHLSRQLERLDLHALFADVLSGSDQEISKAEILRRSGLRPDERDVLIGDTESDLQAGRQVGIRTIGVTWGIRARRALAEENPDVLVDRFEQLAIELLRGVT